MSKKTWSYFISTLFIVTVLVWLAVIQIPTGNLRIIACSVGQGDAYLVEKDQFQMLIDGGPNNDVVNCLGKYMPFWDRNIEIMVSTHPDSDHYKGLIEVMKRYSIGKLIASEANKDNASYNEFKSTVEDAHLDVHLARAGDKINVGMIHFVILNPSNDMFIGERAHEIGGMDISDAKSNDYSITMHITYGEFDALTTGDLSPAVSARLIGEGLIPAVDYLDVPHHGSHNGLTKELLDQTNPAIAVISVGKNNRYGFPHSEVISLLKDKGTKYLRTDLPAQAGELGDVVIETDGNTWKQIK